MNVATETPSFANRPPLATPPDPLAARVDALRKAFWAALQDPELRADAKRASLEVDPVSADDVHALIKKIYAAPKALPDQIKKALHDK